MRVASGLGSAKVPRGLGKFPRLFFNSPSTLGTQERGEGHACISRGETLISQYRAGKARPSISKGGVLISQGLLIAEYRAGNALPREGVLIFQMYWQRQGLDFQVRGSGTLGRRFPQGG